MSNEEYNRVLAQFMAAALTGVLANDATDPYFDEASTHKAERNALRMMQRYVRNRKETE